LAGVCLALALALAAGCEKRESFDLDAFVEDAITSPESMAHHRETLVKMEEDGSAAGIFLGALREHDPDRYNDVADAVTHKMVLESMEPVAVVRKFAGAYTPEVSKRLSRLSDREAAEFIDIRIAMAAYKAHRAELERNPLPDPEAQAARIACDEAMFQWVMMADLPIEKRGAIFRATQRPS
jgi:hypothetical protein